MMATMRKRRPPFDELNRLAAEGHHRPICLVVNDSPRIYLTACPWEDCGWISDPNDPRDHEAQAIAHAEASPTDEPATTCASCKWPVPGFRLPRLQRDDRLRRATAAYLRRNGL
jgi:hypothetical protein